MGEERNPPTRGEVYHGKRKWFQRGRHKAAFEGQEYEYKTVTVKWECGHKSWEREQVPTNMIGDIDSSGRCRVCRYLKRYLEAH